MKPAAGSALWLLRHELRMFLIGVSGARSKQRGKRTALAVWAAAALAMHWFAFYVVHKLGTSGGGAPPQALLAAVTGIMFGAFTLMLSTGLRASVEVLFERGDLDLLLSSPLSSRSIFAVRLAGIAAGTCALFLFFLAPFAHAGLLLGQPRWLGIYPAVLSMAALAASLAILLTLALVRWLGVRRTRVMAQILGAIAGALLFLLSQTFGRGMNDLPQRALAALAQWAGRDSLLWLPSRAALGSPWDALAMAGAGAVVFWLTVRLTHRFFVHGLQQAVSTVRVAKAPAGGLRFRFGRSLALTVMVKEWRLILRDPQLISQVLLQLLYLLPLFLPLFLGRPPSVPGTGAALVFLCAALAASLAWLIIAAEDAPDLLRAAPCSQGTVRRAKLAAAALPPLALVLAPLGWFALHQPGAALLMLVMAGIASVSAALVVLWCARPAERGQFRARGKKNLLGSVLEMLTGAAWAGSAFVLLARVEAGAWSALLAAGAGAAVAVACGVLALAWALRRHPD